MIGKHGYRVPCLPIFLIRLSKEHPKQSDDIDNIGEYRIGEYPKLFGGISLSNSPMCWP